MSSGLSSSSYDKRGHCHGNSPLMTPSLNTRPHCQKLPTYEFGNWASLWVLERTLGLWPLVRRSKYWFWGTSDWSLHWGEAPALSHIYFETGTCYVTTLPSLGSNLQSSCLGLRMLRLQACVTISGPMNFIQCTNSSLCENSFVYYHPKHHSISFS